MYAIYCAGLLIISRHLLKNYQQLDAWQAWAWLLIVAGAVSNLGERAVFGHVRDWIYVTAYWTGVYNLADGYILAGAALLLALNWRKNQT